LGNLWLQSEFLLRMLFCFRPSRLISKDSPWSGNGSHQHGKLLLPVSANWLLWDSLSHTWMIANV